MPRKKNEVIICQNNGLYKLNFKDNNKDCKDNNKDKLKRINDIKYKLLLKIPNKVNEYIVSIPKQEAFKVSGTFKVSRDISTISKSDDLDFQISDKVYIIGKIIEFNNCCFVILINNIENGGILEIIDIENIKNKYTIKNDYYYTLLKNCLVSFKTGNSKNCILLNSSKKGDQNRLSVYNIGKSLDKTLELSLETDNLNITCITPFKNEKKAKEKSFTYCFIGGNRGYYNIEILLYKIIYLDGNTNCLCIKFIKKVVFSNEIISSINSIYPAFNNEGLIIASNIRLYIMNISNKEEKDLQ